ncbi:MAG: AAA family ATPase [Candidatus Thorarchaeota archaeon]
MEHPQKAQNLMNELIGSFVEREEIVKLSLLAVYAGEHVLMIGPPGTAKSLLARTICNAIEGGQYFDYLLTRFTTPDEIFGPLSVKKLEQDEYERKIESYLPKAHIAFLDEIFKANSSILNSLLTLINERVFHNGSNLVRSPLVSIIGASNEIPEEDENLDALYDRFLVRLQVGYVESDESLKAIIFGKAGEKKIKNKFSLQELRQLHKAAQKVNVPARVQDMILVLKRRLLKSKIRISDRRWKQVVGFLKTLAAVNARNAVEETDLLVLRNMLWTEPSQALAISKIVWDVCVSSKQAASSIKSDCKKTEESFNKIALQDSHYGREKQKVPISDFDKKNYLKQLNGLGKSLASAEKEIASRRKRYEKQLDSNPWIDGTGLISDIDSEVAELKKVSELLSKITKKVENWTIESEEDEEEDDDW